MAHDPTTMFLTAPVFSFEEQVLLELEKNPASSVSVDLQDVRSISDSFADEFFAVMARIIGESDFERRVKIENTSPLVQAAIDCSIKARLEPCSYRRREHGFELAPPPAVLETIP